MTGRTLKIALAASVVLNVFLIGAGASAAYMLHHAAKERSAALRSGTPLFVAARDLPPAEQERLREVIHASAKDAWTDFKAAREGRAKAAELAAAPTLDAAAVKAQLEAARADEMRGRVKLENGVIGFMERLSPADRAKIAPVLKGRRLIGRSRHDAHPRPPRS